MMQRKVMLVATAAYALASVAGCYEYRPISSATPPVETPVRLSLTDRGSVDLAPLIGPQIVAVDGVITVARDTSLDVRVTSVTNRVGFESGWNGEPVHIPRGAVSSMQTRTMSKRRSWLAAGLSVAAVALASVTFSLIGGESSSGDTKGGGNTK